MENDAFDVWAYQRKCTLYTYAIADFTNCKRSGITVALTLDHIAFKALYTRFGTFNNFIIDGNIVTGFETWILLCRSQLIVNKLHSLPNVTVHTNAQTTEITGDGSKVNGIRYKDRATGTEHHVELAGVFVQIGLVPNTEFLKGTVELSRYGEILIDARGATNLPGVYAAGDIVRGASLVVWAIRDGRDAADAILDYLAQPAAVAAE